MQLLSDKPEKRDLLFLDQQDPRLIQQHQANRSSPCLVILNTARVEAQPATVGNLQIVIIIQLIILYFTLYFCLHSHTYSFFQDTYRDCRVREQGGAPENLPQQ